MQVLMGFALTLLLGVASSATKTLPPSPVSMIHHVQRPHPIRDRHIRHHYGPCVRATRDRQA